MESRCADSDPWYVNAALLAAALIARERNPSDLSTDYAPCEILERFEAEEIIGEFAWSFGVPDDVSRRYINGLGWERYTVKSKTGDKAAAQNSSPERPAKTRRKKQAETRPAPRPLLPSNTQLHSTLAAQQSFAVFPPTSAAMSPTSGLSDAPYPSSSTGQGHNLYSTHQTAWGGGAPDHYQGDYSSEHPQYGPAGGGQGYQN
ncbi:hypothetical protein B0T16DRAFT_103467 [Cercophora newfieldiana]|uniref:Uncharacterized protein n=1 Tax=Cercophora newfieldiana TaxID=92897 RepID=A0AA40CV38_9PEZI|nr:hypothetical protein B0T16DRAFT_103467 [Cercophora newfieldiana]